MNIQLTAVAAAWLLIAPRLLHAQANAASKPADSTNKAYGYALYATPYNALSYRRHYPLGAGYQPESIRERHYQDSVATANITADMLKDGLIANDNVLEFKLSNKEFVVKGVKQEESVFQRYRQKYVPSVNEGGEWVWTHCVTKP